VTETDFLDEKRKEITDRLAELKPLADEHQRLEAAAEALDGIGGRPSAAPAWYSSRASARRRRPGRPRGSKTGASAAAATKASGSKAAGAKRRRAGRRKGTGKRSAQALALVQEQPGIPVPELATKMGINQNYLYRVLPGLEKEGKIFKEGRGWRPQEEPKTAA
jgi:hypothetical protein